VASGGGGRHSFQLQVGGNGTIYVLGGLDATGAATSTVYEASLNADGSIPQPLPRHLVGPRHAAAAGRCSRTRGHLPTATLCGRGNDTADPVAKCTRRDQHRWDAGRLDHARRSADKRA